MANVLKGKILSGIVAPTKGIFTVGDIEKVVNNASAEAIDAIEQKRASSLASIPADYTSLSESIAKQSESIHDISEKTRNINSSKMGRYRNQNNGMIFEGDNHCYGMGEFVEVEQNKNYIVSVGGLDIPTGTYAMVLECGSDGTVTNYAGGYLDYPFRRVITKPNTVKMNVYIKNESQNLDITSAYMQIEEGDKVTPYIPPVSAKDSEVREKIPHLENAFNISNFIDNTVNLDDLDKNCAYRWNAASVPVNAPTRNQARILNFESDNADNIGKMQIVVDNTNTVYVRYYTYVGYSGWAELVTKEYVDNKLANLFVTEGKDWD